MGLFSFLKDIPIVGDIVGAAEDYFGVGDSSAKALQGNQAQINKDTALWNMENVTKPVFEMENAEWNRRFAEQNAEWERQWNMQNEYNSPGAQAQRMRQGGFNPAGMDLNGGGQAGAGAVGNPSVNEAASAMAQPASLYEAKQIGAQNALAQANAIAAFQKARLTERDIQEKTINNKTLAELNQGRVELQNCQIETEKTNQKLTRQKVKESKALVKQIDSYSAYLDKQLPILDQQLQNIKEEFWDIRAKIRQTNAQTEKTDQETLNAQQDHFYKTIINKYLEENQQWLIKEAKSRYNLNSTQAYEAMQEAKLMIQEGTIKDWKFKNSRYAWNTTGRWEVGFNGMIANWQYRNASMFTNLEESKMNFEQMRNGIEARFFFINNVINSVKQKGNDFFGKVATGSGGAGLANKALGGAEGYQFFE